MLRERRRHANYKPNRRLDRKSSRGMIYENEELRMRTININAEVERGQSDIRKLRRENEQLKREIWSLRDEYERINKKMCARRNCGSFDTDLNNSDSQTEDSDSCDACREDDLKDAGSDDLLSLEYHQRAPKDTTTGTGTIPIGSNDSTNQEIAENYENSQKTLAASIASTSSGGASTIGAKHNCKTPPTTESVSNKLRENLHVNFGHLSVLSEENLTNSSGDGASMNGDGVTILSVDVTTVADAMHPMASNSGDLQAASSTLREIQSIQPPLSHFENIPYDRIGHISSSLDDLNYSTTSTTTTSETIVPASGWDFNVVQQYAASRQPRDLVPRTPGTTTTTTSTAAATTAQFRSPKHFFSPIKPRAQQPQPPVLTTVPPSSSLTSSSFQTNPPDLFVANALASPYQRPCPVRNSPPLVTRPNSPNFSYQDGNLEDLLLEIESLQMQLEKHKSFSQEKLPTSSEILSNRKPYRSEMNLVVSCNGSKPVITPISKTTSASLASGFAYNCNYFAAGGGVSSIATTNSSAMDTPPPNIPHPMILFPQNLTYLGRENYCGGGSVPTLTGADITDYGIAAAVRAPTPIVVDAMPSSLGLVAGSAALAAAAPSALPPPYGPILPRIDDKDREVNAAAVAYNSPKLQSRKSPAAARRKLFTNRSGESASATTIAATSTTNAFPAVASILPAADAPPPTDKISQRTDSNASDNLQNDSSSGSDTTKRKSARRVSIVFNGGASKKSTDAEKALEKERDRRTEANTLTNKTTTSDLGTSLTNDLLQKSQRSPADLVTQSTPNSPHSGTRRNSAAHSLSSHSHHHHQQQQQHVAATGHHHSHHSSRKLSQDSVKFQAKCSRRYSEGTVDATTLSNTSPFNSTYCGGGGSVITGGGSETNRHDSFQEPGTSISERNSNSFESSRESSTSQSTPSQQRRKISVSSHNGGKIPWCGCWGNGCL